MIYTFATGCLLTADMIPAPNLSPWATKYAPLLKLFTYSSNGDPEYLPSSVGLVPEPGHSISIRQDANRSAGKRK